MEISWNFVSPKKWEPWSLLKAVYLDLEMFSAASFSGGIFTHIGSAMSAYSFEPTDRHIYLPTKILQDYIRKGKCRQNITVYPFMKSGRW